jgi:hypothetical protein
MRTLRFIAAFLILGVLLGGMALASSSGSDAVMRCSWFDNPTLAMLGCTTGTASGS